MPFIALSNADVDFTKREKLYLRSYTTAKALLTTNRIELNDKKEFAKIALDENLETFVIYVSARGH